MIEHQIEPKKTYLFVFLALIVLTFVTTGVAYIDLGVFSVVVALVIAVCKMMLVALFFMHIRHSTQLTRLVIGGGLLWLLILIGLSMADFHTRGWLPVPGK